MGQKRSHYGPTYSGQAVHKLCSPGCVVLCLSNNIKTVRVYFMIFVLELAVMQLSQL